MRTKEQLLKAVYEAIDAQRDKIIAIGERVWKNPEPGYREYKTSELARKTLEDLGLKVSGNYSITGMRADLPGASQGPKVAILGEMDSLLLPTHPECDPETGAVHACGHNAHITGMLGAAIGLVNAKAAKELAGTVAFIPCPAEECIELGWRNELIKQGKIKVLGGKASMILEGVFDDIDIAMMNHVGGGYSAAGHNGFVMKHVAFKGTSTHAAYPQASNNALSAANLALHGLALLRETFSGDSYIRAHGILTNGGDTVNIIPDTATLEYQLRAETLDKIKNLSAKFDRCVKGCASALGCHVDITTMHGYLPTITDPDLLTIYGDVVHSLQPEVTVAEKQGFSTGSTDMGDVSQIIPAIHGTCKGARGTGHGISYGIDNPELAYIENAKILAGMAVELLYGDAESGKKIAARKPSMMSIEEYKDIVRGFSTTESTQNQE